MLYLKALWDSHFEMFSITSLYWLLTVNGPQQNNFQSDYFHAFSYIEYPKGSYKDKNNIKLVKEELLFEKPCEFNR